MQIDSGMDDIISAFEAGWAASASPRGTMADAPDHLRGWWQDGFAAARAAREDDRDLEVVGSARDTRRLH